MTDYKPKLPNIFPRGKILVEDEEHIYQTYEGDNGSILEELEYTLDKAPIDSITSVSGVIDGQVVEFKAGTDYELSTDEERIVWQNDSSSDRPDAGSTFYVNYRCDSIISRYLESSSEELENVDGEIEDVIASKFVETAEGRDLDELGKLFGILGKRRGRDDQQYRIYLKSIVQSFVSRGTVQGIKLAISAATETPVKDITIRENFQDNEYEVVVIPNTPVTASILEEIAEIADPSGVSQLLTRFVINDQMGVDDIIDVVDGIDVSDNLTVNDTVQSFGRQRFETIVSDDTAAYYETPVQFETAFFDDTVTSSQTSLNWNEQNWDASGFIWAGGPA